MKKRFIVSVCFVIALAVLVGGALAQKKPDVVGTWVGYGIAPGMRFELTAVFDKGEAGYTGKLSDNSGTITDSPLREVTFKDEKLSFEFDLVMGMDPMLIKIELTLENDVLKGFWFDVEGNSDVVELTRKK
jgi:hypothetical protein